MPPDSAHPLPEKDMDITEDELMVFSWKLADFDKRLTYDLNKCIGCGACVEVCPTRAIELGPVVEIAQGQLEGTPAVIIDHDACGYCGLCKFVCPTHAIDIEVNPPGKINWDQYPRVRPFGKIDPEKCKEDASVEVCQQCIEARAENDVKAIYKLVDTKACPYDALILKSPYEGTVKIYKNLLYKCDPNGCKACVNICPTESFSIPQKADDIVRLGKVAVDSEKCIHCGACELACPEKIIEVKRENIAFTDGETGRAWTVAWNELYGHLLSEREICIFCKDRDLLPILEEPEAELGDETKGASVEQDFTPPQSELDRMERQYNKVLEILGKVKTRYQMERGNISKIRELFAEKPRNSEGGESA